MHNYRVTEKNTNKRLDIFVSSKFPKFSRAYIQKIIKNGEVTVNKAVEKLSYKIKPGDKVRVLEVESKEPVTKKSWLPILFEDDDLIVINKPEGVLSHSKGAFNPEPTVATWIKPFVSGLEGSRAGIVHRLDRLTSGVMIVAKNPISLQWLQKQFSQRKVKKQYVALITGRLDPAEAIIDMPIERNPKIPASFRAGFGGKSAQTSYRVLKSNDHYSIVQLMPTTGRTHQLRVHLAKLNHPIVGDSLYKGEPADRMYLHATSLEFTSPKHERKKFTVTLPTSFEKKYRT